MVTHLCTIMCCSFKDKSSIYSERFLVSLSSYFWFCCSYVLIHSVTFFTVAGFEILFAVVLRLYRQCQVQQSVHSFVSGTLLRVISLLQYVSIATPASVLSCENLPHWIPEDGTLCITWLPVCTAHKHTYTWKHALPRTILSSRVI